MTANKTVNIVRLDKQKAIEYVQNFYGSNGQDHWTFFNNIDEVFEYLSLQKGAIKLYFNTTKYVTAEDLKFVGAKNIAEYFVLVQEGIYITPYGILLY